MKFYFKIERNENVFNCFIRFWLVLNILVLTFIQITVTDDESTVEEKMSFPVGQDIQSVNIVNMDMPEGLKNITVQAINKLLLTSDQVIYNFTAVHSKPTKKGMRLHCRNN